MRRDFLPYGKPAIGEEEIAEVVDSLRSGWITTGPKTKRFEEAFRDYVGASHAVAVNSCTGALHLALAALGVGQGDEVILSTLTFCSACNVILHLGATPVLVDIGEDFNLDPEAVRNSISDRTRAIMVTHFGGQACDIQEIFAMAAEVGVPVVEDAAHAVGGEYRGIPIGSDQMRRHFAQDEVDTVSCFSFYPIKNMTTGEGGMITTSDPALAERMALLSLHGMSTDAWKRYQSKNHWYYEVVAAGFKYNMTDLQAALGIHQLRKLDEFIKRRRLIAAKYEQGFSDLEGVRLPRVHSDRKHTFNLYVIRLNKERVEIGRDDFIRQLAEQKVGTSVHFIPIHRHPYYRECGLGGAEEFPVADEIYDEIVSLPLYPSMTDDDVDDVIAAVRNVVMAERA